MSQPINIVTGGTYLCEGHACIVTKLSREKAILLRVGDVTYPPKEVLRDKFHSLLPVAPCKTSTPTRTKCNPLFLPTLEQEAPRDVEVTFDVLLPGMNLFRVLHVPARSRYNGILHHYDVVQINCTFLTPGCGELDEDDIQQVFNVERLKMVFQEGNCVNVLHWPVCTLCHQVMCDCEAEHLKLQEVIQKEYPFQCQHPGCSEDVVDMCSKPMCALCMCADHTECRCKDDDVYQGETPLLRTFIRVLGSTGAGKTNMANSVCEPSAALQRPAADVKGGDVGDTQRMEVFPMQSCFTGDNATYYCDGPGADLSDITKQVERNNEEAKFYRAQTDAGIGAFLVVIGLANDKKHRTWVSEERLVKRQGEILRVGTEEIMKRTVVALNDSISRKVFVPFESVVDVVVGKHVLHIGSGRVGKVIIPQHPGGGGGVVRCKMVDETDSGECDFQVSEIVDFQKEIELEEEMMRANGVGMTKIVYVNPGNWSDPTKTQLDAVERSMLLRLVRTMQQVSKSSPPLRFTHVLATVTKAHQTAVVKLKDEYGSKISHNKSVKKVTIHVQCLEDGVRPAVEALKPYIAGAVRRYCHLRRECMEKYHLEDSHEYEPGATGTDLADVFQVRWDHLDDKTRRGIQQEFSAAEMYLAFPSGKDCLPEGYKISYAGEAFRIFLQNTRKVRPGQTWRITPDTVIGDEVTIEMALPTLSPDYDPTNVSKFIRSATQRWELANFCKTFNTAPNCQTDVNRLFPKLLPLDSAVHAGTGKTWKTLVTESVLSARNVNVGCLQIFMNAILESVQRGIPINAWMAQGIPGTGKTSLYRNIGILLGSSKCNFIELKVQDVFHRGLKGDANAMMTAMFTRLKNCPSVCGIFLDEWNYAVTKKSQEHMGPVLTYMNDMNPQFFMYVACNDWSEIPDNIMSRFGLRCVVVPVMTHDELLATVKVQRALPPDERLPIFKQALLKPAVTDACIARGLMGLSHRDIFTKEPHATAKQYQTKQNPFDTETTTGTNLVHLLETTHTQKCRVELAKFLCAEHNNITGRIIVQSLADAEAAYKSFVVVDVEMKTPTKCTKGFMMDSLEGVYWTLSELAATVKASVYNFHAIKPEFPQQSSVLKALHVTPYTSSINVLPFYSSGFNTGGTGVSQAAQGEIATIIQNEWFKTTEPGRKNIVVLIMKSYKERCAINGFEASQEAKKHNAHLALQYKENVTCITCGRTFKQENKHQNCVHAPRNGDSKLKCQFLYKEKDIKSAAPMTIDDAKKNLQTDHTVVKVLFLCGRGCYGTDVYTGRGPWVNCKCPCTGSCKTNHSGDPSVVPHTCNVQLEKVVGSIDRYGECDVTTLTSPHWPAPNGNGNAEFKTLLCRFGCNGGFGDIKGECKNSPHKLEDPPKPIL